MVSRYKYMQSFGRFGKDVLPKNAHMICISIGSVGNIAMVMNSLYFMGEECESVYIDFSKKELMNWVGSNPYDEVFKQSLSEDYEQVSCWGNVLFDWDASDLEDIRNTVKPYFHFNNDLMDEVNEFNNVGADTLGVHVRMSDMNSWHGDQFGYVYYDNYIYEIDYMLAKNSSIKNIFVASDNKETLDKLIGHYGNIIYHPNVSRTDNEHEVGTEAELRRKGHKRMEGFDNFYTPFIDMLLLSRCGYFIGRKYSNFSIASIMLGSMKYDNIINLS